MAQLDFYMTKENSRQIVINYLLNEGYIFVPTSCCYDTPQACRLTDFNDILKQRPMHFFLTHSDLTIYDFSFDKIEKDGKDCYYIMDKYGGPYLEFSNVNERVEDGIRNYSNGFIAIYSAYYKSNEGEFEYLDRTKVKEHYNKICNHIRRHTKVLTLTFGRTYRITSDMINEIQSGSSIGLNEYIEKIS